MKNKVLYILSVLTAVSCGAGEPKIKAIPEMQDLGEMRAGSSSKGQFNIYNPGSANLIIKAVEGSCSCTSVSITKKIIVPGDSAKVNYRMKALDHEGKVYNRILLRNNSKREFYFLGIKAQVHKLNNPLRSIAQ